MSIESARREPSGNPTVVYNDAEHHESIPPTHWQHSRSRATARALARHWLHGGCGVRLFDHGLTDETPVLTLWTAASLLSALHLFLAVSTVADHMAALVGKFAPEQSAAAFI